MRNRAHAQAPEGAAGACRRNRRRRQGARRPEWVRPYRRAQRALDSAIHLLFSTMGTAIESERCAQRRPIRSARKLNDAMRQMTVAARRLTRAHRELAEANDALGRAPEQCTGEVPELMEMAAERCQAVEKHIGVAVTDVFLLQIDVLAGLATGELVPEHPSDSRPRIILKPRPIPVRAFLAVRQARVSERITPVLRRRRRTLRPAEVRVPRPNLRGRAPPLSSTCSL